MKVLILVARYYPSKGGVEIVTQYLAEGLVKLGHEVTIVTRTLDGTKNKDIHNGVNIIRFNIWDKFTIHHGNKKEYQKLVMELADTSDVLISCCLQAAVTDWILPILDDIKCPKLLYMHGMNDFNWHKSDFLNLNSLLEKIVKTIRWGIFYKFNRSKIKKFDLSSHLHEFDDSYRYFKKYNMGKKIVMHNAANDNFFNNQERSNEKTIIYVANYYSRKNQRLALETFYKTSTKNYSLICIGSEENKYYHELVKYKEKLDEEYGEKKVDLLVGIDRSEVSRKIKEANIFLMTSKWEAFPISIIEAMSANIPFISTDVGIVKYLPGGVTAQSKEELEYWLELLISNESVAQKLGNLGNSYAQTELKCDVQVEKFENILLNLKNKRGVYFVN